MSPFIWNIRVFAISACRRDFLLSEPELAARFALVYLLFENLAK
jgi:hypothetical protein